MKPQYRCEHCGATHTVRGNRFCGKCRKAELAKMKTAGYLGPNPRLGNSRPSERRQAYDFDMDASGGWANAVRALEDNG